MSNEPEHDMNWAYSSQPGDDDYVEEVEPPVDEALKIKAPEPEKEPLGVLNEHEETGDIEFDRDRRINSGLDQAFLSDSEKAAAQKAGERFDLDLENEFDRADEKLEYEQAKEKWFATNPEAASLVDEFEILDLPEHLGPLTDESQFNMQDRFEIAKLMHSAENERDPRHKLLLADVWSLIQDGLNLLEIEEVLNRVGPPEIPVPIVGNYALPGSENDNELNKLTAPTLKKNLEPHNVL